MAQTDAAREFKSLAEQHNKALAAAVEPVNRRYKEALEQLVRRATQNNDLDTAVKIREVLKAIDRDSVAEAAGESISTRIVNTTWTWWERETITFEKGGKMRWSGGQTWSWGPGTTPNVVSCKMSNGKLFTVRFNADSKTGMIEGDLATRETRAVMSK